MPFDIYKVISVTPIAGVGRSKAHKIGQGGLHLKSKCNDAHIFLSYKMSHMYYLKTKHHPITKAMGGRWTKSYKAYNGKLDFLIKERICCCKGHQSAQ